jgi:hypothetical protein
MAKNLRNNPSTPAPAQPAPTAAPAPAPKGKTPASLPPITNGPSAPVNDGFGMLEQLKGLRAKLDAGQIAVSDFLKQGQTLAQGIFNEQLRLGAGGSTSAQQGDALRNAFAAANTGFRQEATGDAKTGIKTDLPQEYQVRLREELIPANIQGEERQALLDKIPLDIGFDTERFKIEQEGVRQAIQAKTAAGEQATRRQQGLVDLTKLLTDRDDRLFKEAIPQISEDANAKGLLTSSGYGEALAREKARLASGTSEAIAMQGLSDRDLDVNSIASILSKQQGFQSDGLSREFSTTDSNKAFNEALRLAKENQPGTGSKSGGEKVAEGAKTAAAVAALFK